MAVNFAKLPELLREPSSGSHENELSWLCHHNFTD